MVGVWACFESLTEGRGGEGRGGEGRKVDWSGCWDGG